MRKLLASLALGLLALPLAAVPASAHDDGSDHHIAWGDNRGDNAPKDGDRLFGHDFVPAFTRFEDGVARWRIEMRSEAGGQVSFCDKLVANEDTTPSYPLLCNWDTQRVGDMTNLGSDQDLAGAPLAPNGRWVITVTAWNAAQPCTLLCERHDPNVPHVLQPSRTVIVENPVAEPSGVARSFDSGRRVARVTWNANPEPDIQKYVIQEKVGDGAWIKVGESPGGSTSFDRPITDPGTYQYRVAAVRPEVPQSSFATAEPLEVTVPDLSAPAATAGEPAPDGGEPGVTVPEPSTTSTTVGGATGSSAPRPRSGGGSSLFSRPSANYRPPSFSAPTTTPTTADTGYSETLPYKPKAPDSLAQNGELAGAEEPQVIKKFIEIPRPRDARSLLIPLAGGLALFVFAMQMTYMARSRPMPVATVEDDFGDWLGL